ncbi:hypothetical protein RN001_011112 [Aquatica leii]|uniref:Uncharacterized protein n=1 Tax=Aquatica leii TaxID=1421715 RepID=A0AAN7PAN6_9COLE|nr:hypothetical protein RN001_011112 [Aquatica leii]
MDNLNNASSQIPILGRPRGLVPAKNAAERMREYRQRKKNRNNNFKQNRLLKNNISTDQIIQVSEPLINNDAVIIAGPSCWTFFQKLI